MLEAKAPGIDQRSHGDIEGTLSFTIYMLCQIKYLLKHCIPFYS